jgi:hypothetical protein
MLRFQETSGGPILTAQSAESPVARLERMPRHELETFYKTHNAYRYV